MAKTTTATTSTSTLATILILETNMSLGENNLIPVRSVVEVEFSLADE